MKERLSQFEISVAALSGVVVFVATLTGPRLSQGGAPDTLAVMNIRQERQIENLEASLQTVQEKGVTLETQLAEAGRQLEELQAALVTATETRDTLATQLAKATERVQQLEARVMSSDEKLAKFKELLSVREANQERDAAKAEAEAAAERAKKAEDRVRELTLQLHRSGIWP